MSRRALNVGGSGELSNASNVRGSRKLTVKKEWVWTWNPAELVVIGVGLCHGAVEWLFGRLELEGERRRADGIQGGARVVAAVADCDVGQAEKHGGRPFASGLQWSHRPLFGGWNWRGWMKDAWDDGAGNAIEGQWNNEGGAVDERVGAGVDRAKRGRVCNAQKKKKQKNKRSFRRKCDKISFQGSN